MSEEQPYNDEQWSDLPLPDADKAWQRMEVLLHEDERRRVMPWWFWRTAAGILLLLATAFGGWWALRSKGGEEKKRRPVSIAVKEHPPISNNQSQRQPDDFPGQPSAKQKKPVHLSASPDEKNVANRLTPSARKPSTSPQEGLRYLANSRSAVQQQQHRQVNKAKPAKPAAASLPLAQKENTSRDEAEPSGAGRKKEAAAAAPLEKAPEDSLQASLRLKKEGVSKTDSIKAVVPPAAPTNEKKSPSKKPAFVCSAGVGLQQAIALQRQPSALTGSLQRKRAFFNYFPSVYVKAARGRWAAQAEFQYGVPQPVAALPFSQKTTYDATAMATSVERYTLQKLYYHRLPVSVNYHLLPQWSVGGGGVYNIFSGAVMQKEVVSKNALTGVEAVSKNTETRKGYTDSFFYKTTAGLLLQTDYHWKRFSLGLCYTQNLQPFIKYTEPNGAVLDKKNNALQAVLRFRLWGSE